MNKLLIGKLGEHYALDHLLKQKHCILDLNYFTRFGELDIISFDLKNKSLVFTEVKTSSKSSSISPESVLTNQKLSRVVKSALIFLDKQKKSYSWRIDFIAIKLDKNYALKYIKHFEQVGFEGFDS